MALIRCTCIYRPSTADEVAHGAGAITVAFRDPWCHALDLHHLPSPVEERAVDLP
jgi:hypothetical protein